ncbi:MAG: hypothetical protein LBC20_18500 [Planctomycetaceae bacterium]|jgi:hypothetical protein|nr:hypothetical protein [Planctomycetaceae bacterium]
MKTLFLQLVLMNLVFVAAISVSYGDWLTEEEQQAYINSNASLETLRINDNTTDTNEGSPNPLYRIFNEYFSNELSQGYSSGNELADDRMIRETILSWHVNPGSDVVASFTSSAWNHGFQIYDQNTGSLEYNSKIYDSTETGQAIIEEETAIPISGGDYTFSVNNYGYDKTFSGNYDWYYETEEYLDDPARLTHFNDGFEHLIVFDVTDLMQARYGIDIESAYLFALEDMAVLQGSDFDYQDFAFILTNVTANTVPTVTPEPATALIFGLAGGIAIPFLRRKRNEHC